MIKYVVFDECSELSSEAYESIEDAQYDLDHNVTYGWSTNAQIVEVND